MMYHTLTSDTICLKILFSHVLLLNGINWTLEFEKSRASLILKKIFWANSVFNCNSSKGLKFVTRLHLGLSQLRKHKLKHSFQDSINPLCSCSLDVESAIHYFFHCPLFTIERHTLLNTISQTDKKLLDSNESDLIHLFWRSF